MQARVELQIGLYGHTQGSPITIQTQQDQKITLEDGASTVTVSMAAADRLPLFRITNIRQGLEQRITVRSIHLNGVLVRDHSRLLTLEARDNAYQLDRDHNGTSELSFNGWLIMDTSHRARWLWTDWHRSDRRWDWVFQNDRHDCSDPRHCWSRCGDPAESTHLDHLRTWTNGPTWPTEPTSMDTACFGCSITEGSALIRGQEWPALLPGHTVNFAQAMSGVDAIWMNLRRALETHRPGRVVILLPSWHRRLARITRNGETLRMPVTVTQRQARDKLPSFWWHAHDRESLRRQAQTRLIRFDHRRRGLRIIDRMRYLLEAWGGDYWLASHDPETHADLERLSVMTPDHILPRFTNDRGAPDGLHSSARSHQEWVARILPRIR